MTNELLTYSSHKVIVIATTHYIANAFVRDLMDENQLTFKPYIFTTPERLRGMINNLVFVLDIAHSSYSPAMWDELEILSRYNRVFSVRESQEIRDQRRQRLQNIKSYGKTSLFTREALGLPTDVVVNTAVAPGTLQVGAPTLTYSGNTQITNIKF